MGELTAAVGAPGHREPEVCSTLLKVRHGSEVREMWSVSAGSSTECCFAPVRPELSPNCARLCPLKSLRRLFFKRIIKYLFLI